MATNKFMEIVMKKEKATSKQPSLDELVFGALSQLQILGYDGRSIRRYQAVWNRLVQFANKIILKINYRKN